MSGSVIILGEIIICLDFLVRPGSWVVATCDDFVVIPYGILAEMVFDIITGAISGVTSFARWMFTPESEITSIYFLGELGGFLILLIKLVLSVLILVLFVITPNCHPHPFFCPKVFL